MTEQRIAFIGLGNMGNPMAANLAEAGHAVTGFDLSAAARAQATVPLAENAVAAATGADVLITMLPAGRHVIEVFGQLLPLLRAGALAIDCSTVDVASARAAHEIAAAQGIACLDAPVSGGVGGALAGTLTFMAGGGEDAFARGEKLLQCMGRKIIHCGGAGAGQAAKICNNMILGISMIATCEAFVLGEKLGLTHQALFDVASVSSGQSWSLTSYCPVPGPVAASPANKGYEPGFSAALMLKDLKLAQEAALQSGAATPLGAEAMQLYALFNQLGNGAKDFSGMIEFLRARP